MTRLDRKFFNSKLYKLLGEPTDAV